MKNRPATFAPVTDMRWALVFSLAAVLLFNVTMSTMIAPSHAAPAASHTVAASPLDLYGPAMSFDIYRDGARIGEHRVAFEEIDNRLHVRTDFQLAIGALFFTLFELTYTSDAVWREGQLISLNAYTNRNGDESEVRAQQSDEGLLRVSGPNGVLDTPAGIYPTNHWNAGVISSSTLLNTITGKANSVTLKPLGVERVQTNVGPVEATRYRYVGEIENEVWYDPDGRWVAMQFPGDDGSLIELRCKQCVRPAADFAQTEIQP